MSRDAYVDSIDHLADLAREAHEALDRSVAAAMEVRRERLAGAQVSVVVSHAFERGGKEIRLASSAALSKYERGVTAYRATTIRILVDHEGMTFSALAEIFGVSRQMVARLYRTVTPSEWTTADGSPEMTIN